MTGIVTRRAVLRLAGAASAWAAMAGALRAEGGSVLDMLTQMSEPPFAGETPVSIGTAALRVRNLDMMTAFYTEGIGLEVLSSIVGETVLGVAGRPLLHLIARPQSPFEAPSEAGLYHIAFLMPSRPALARWLVHSVYLDIPLTGFSDHRVSEAIYLNDPEGNGLEIYADRPRGSWLWTDGKVTMGSAPLDIDSLLMLTDTSRDTYDAAPSDLLIGHMHLRVGHIATGRTFYEEAIGLDHVVEDRFDSAFMSSGGYHHHVALNTWQSAGARARASDVAGLDWFSLLVRDEAILDEQIARLSAAGISVETIADGYGLADPWGTGVRLIRG